MACLLSVLVPITKFSSVKWLRRAVVGLNRCQAWSNCTPNTRVYGTRGSVWPQGSLVEQPGFQSETQAGEWEAVPSASKPSQTQSPAAARRDPRQRGTRLKRTPRRFHWDLFTAAVLTAIDKDPVFSRRVSKNKGQISSPSTVLNSGR